MYSQYLYLCLPVSGSYTLLTWACCFSYSSLVMGTIDLSKRIRNKTVSNPVPLSDLFWFVLLSRSFYGLLLFSLTWLLCHYFFYRFFFSQSQILSGKVQAHSFWSIHTFTWAPNLSICSLPWQLISYKWCRLWVSVPNIS